MNNSIRRRIFSSTLCGALFAFAPLTVAFSQAAPASKNTQEQAACTCTCEACLAKHGPKVKPAKANEVEISFGTAVAVESARTTAPAAQRERGFLGVYLGGVDDGGVAIANVIDGGAAQRAGMKEGDLIVVAEELPITSMQDLLGVLSKLKVGDVATFEVERGDDELNFLVKLGARPSVDGAETTQAPGRLMLIAPKPIKPKKPANAAERKRKMRSDFFLGRGEADAPKPDTLRGGADETAAMRRQVEALEKQVAELRKIVKDMQQELKHRRR